MATLKAIVKAKMKNGMYNVYIRFTQNRQFSYFRTSWMVNEKGLSDDKKDIIDPFVIQQTSVLIDKFYTRLNQVDSSNWSASEVLQFVQDFDKDMSFSDYARKHIDKLIARGQERTSRNYKWAILDVRRENHGVFETAHDTYAEKCQRTEYRLGVYVQVEHEQRKNAERNDYAVEYVNSLQGVFLFVSLQIHIVRVLIFQKLLSE